METDLDVESQPDPDLYNLIRLSIVGRFDEPALWPEFLEAARSVGADFAVSYHGSYQTHFLKPLAQNNGPRFATPPQKTKNPKKNLDRDGIVT